MNHSTREGVQHITGRGPNGTNRLLRFPSHILGKGEESQSKTKISSAHDKISKPLVVAEGGFTFPLACRFYRTKARTWVHAGLSKLIRCEGGHKRVKYAG